MARSEPTMPATEPMRKMPLSSRLSLVVIIALSLVHHVLLSWLTLSSVPGSRQARRCPIPRRQCHQRQTCPQRRPVARASTQAHDPLYVEVPVTEPILLAKGVASIRCATSSGSSSCGKCLAVDKRKSSELGNRSWKMTNFKLPADTMVPSYR